MKVFSSVGKGLSARGPLKIPPTQPLSARRWFSIHFNRFFKHSTLRSNNLFNEKKSFNRIQLIFLNGFYSNCYRWGRVEMAHVRLSGLSICHFSRLRGMENFLHIFIMKMQYLYANYQIKNTWDCPADAVWGECIKKMMRNCLISAGLGAW